jgi:hypothetical protein
VVEGEWGWLEANGGGEGGCGGGGRGEDERTLTVMQVDVILKLRSPSKITFDMNVGQLDNEIKTYII